MQCASPYLCDFVVEESNNFAPLPMRQSSGHNKECRGFQASTCRRAKRTVGSLDNIVQDGAGGVAHGCCLCCVLLDSFDRWISVLLGIKVHGGVQIAVLNRRQVLVLFCLLSTAGCRARDDSNVPVPKDAT